MELVLNTVYEPLFQPTSHGFRPNKSAHSALKMIDVPTQFKGASWFIEADITKCFDSINHSQLLSITSRVIKCQKTLALIRNSLKAGHVELGKDGDASLRDMTGTPQGSVLSPLLCNIYLHELDKHMREISNEYDKGDSRRKSPAYTRIRGSHAIGKAKSLRAKKGWEMSSPIPGMREKISHPQLLRQQLRQIRAKDMMDPNFVRVRYVRYADDFLISVIGPRSLALEIKERVSQFLAENLGLQMNEAKTSITNASQHTASFLGTYIR